ncbi:MAG: RNase P subunit p30 family protein [Nanoarchaeota archaeon]
MIDIVCFPGTPLDLGFQHVYVLSAFKAVAAQKEELLKRAVQSRHVDFIYNLEQNPKKDKTNHRASGLNQVYCTFLRDTQIAVAFNLNLLLHAPDRTVILGRMMQNIRLCRKYKVRMILASFATHPYEQRAPQDLLAFGRCIGMIGREAKDALQFARKMPDVAEI